MNEQQLQQILTIQQAIAAAATAAVINSLLNPQQAAGLANANALTDPSNDLQASAPQQQHHLQQQSQLQENRQSPTNNSSPATAADCNTRIQDLLFQLQQQASINSSPLNLNLNTQPTGLGNSPIRSPVNRLAAQDQLNSISATTSNTQQQQSITNQASPIKKLKRHHQQPYPNRSLEATSKPQHSSPKSQSAISNLSGRNSNTGSNNNSNNNNSSSSSSSAFIANNVGLPRKLVRGQDVWLGRGAEQTRQILKCMWCGQSFRTLAEMTQHMKITQHYTNIISQEQITSWRQPESSEAINNNKHGKQSNPVRSLEDNHDDLSDKFNDSDRDDSFSNDDILESQPPQKHRPISQQVNRIDQSKIDSTDNNSAAESSHGESPGAAKGSPRSKPLTRSRKREKESLPIKREAVDRENSPATSSSSQQRQNSSNLISGDSNEDSEVNKECKLNGSSQESSTESTTKTTKASVVTKRDSSKERNIDGDNVDNDVVDNDDDDDGDDDEDDLKKNERRKANGESSEKVKDQETGDSEERDDDDDDDDDAGVDDGDIDDVTQTSETNESVATTTSGANKSVGQGQKGETGDPLSALETMVEKSFDPRLRPGVANGGILQRLGIDEEVCPPWQHINYANWYAAAAYGHPMAAALLAAGINLQNGIKLSKNVGPKKNED